MQSHLKSILHSIFDWRFSSVFGAACLFAGFGAMITDKFPYALFLYAIGGIWLLGWWVIEHPAPKRSQDKWTAKQRRQLYLRWFGGIFFIVLTGGLLLWTLNLKKGYELSLLYGVLFPAKDADPPSVCPKDIGADTFKIYLGSDVVMNNRFPFVVIGVQQNDDEKTWRPVLSVDKKNENLAITVDVIASDGVLIARISRNEFTLNQNSIFRTYKERPDEHTLQVTDNNGKQVLYIRYLNPHTLKILGTLFFNLPAAKGIGVAIDEDGLTPLGLNPTGKSSGDCSIIGPGRSGITFNVNAR